MLTIKWSGDVLSWTMQSAITSVFSGASIKSKGTYPRLDVSPPLPLLPLRPKLREVESEEVRSRLGKRRDAFSDRSCCLPSKGLIFAPISGAMSPHLRQRPPSR